ncbi:unnamed protein product [Brassica napus]|uniref:(rape) hypothetical protein n=1 Tax=Brassica napus TaxID=3708 RepID=A0A816XWD4_BRANA|nr:unnamed protein product [Brassica napus]
MCMCLLASFRMCLFSAEALRVHRSITQHHGSPPLKRFWEDINMKRGELMGIDMIFVDAKSSLMLATVNFNRLPTLRRRLKAGALFTNSGFVMTRCNQNSRLTDSSLTIRFSDSTTFDELTEPVSPIL